MKQEVLRNSAALLSQRFLLGETAVDADGGVDVTVERTDGTTSTGTATSVGNGSYTYSLAPSTEVDLLTVTWTGTFSGNVQSITTQVEVVGGHYFALSELRLMPGLSDVQRYPTAKLAEARTRAQDEIERELGGVALVERFGSTTLAAAGCRRLRPGRFTRRLLSGAMRGIAFTPEQIEAMTVDGDGYVEWSTGWFLGDIELRFAHGYSITPPPEMSDLALELARMRLLGWRSSLPDQTVDADDLGQQTPAGEAEDRAGNQERMVEVLRSWRRRRIGPTVA